MRGLWGAGIGVLAVVCCAGLPLLVAAGASAAAFAWIGGLALFPLALAAGTVVVRARRAAATGCADRPAGGEGG